MSTFTGISCQAWMMPLHTSYGLHSVGLTKRVNSLLSVEKLPRLPDTTRSASAGLHSCNSQLVVSNQSCRVLCICCNCNLLPAPTEASLVPMVLQQAPVCSNPQAIMSAPATCQLNCSDNKVSQEKSIVPGNMSPSQIADLFQAPQPLCYF